MSNPRRRCEVTARVLPAGGLAVAVQPRRRAMSSSLSDEKTTSEGNDRGDRWQWQCAVRQRHRACHGDTTPTTTASPPNLQSRPPAPHRKKTRQCTPLIKTCKRNATQSPVKSFPSIPIGQRWSPFLLPLARHQITLRDNGYETSVSRDVSVYVPAFAGSHCAYPSRDGQAELTWLAGYIPGWFSRLPTVIYPSTITGIGVDKFCWCDKRRYQLSQNTSKMRKKTFCKTLYQCKCFMFFYYIADLTTDPQSSNRDSETFLQKSKQTRTKKPDYYNDKLTTKANKLTSYLITKNSNMHNLSTATKFSAEGAQTKYQSNPRHYHLLPSKPLLPIRKFWIVGVL